MILKGSQRSGGADLALHLMKYMAALEAASIDSNIRPFAEFIAERVQWSMKKAA
jgi:hypothetical protein